MADSNLDCELDDFKHWKVDVLCQFCQDRGFTVSNKKDELVALAYAAYMQRLPVLKSKAQEKAEAEIQYTDLIDGTVISDPLQITSNEWLNEADSLRYWPPCMVMNISEYLIANDEQPLCTRLRNDYKEGMPSYLFHPVICVLLLRYCRQLLALPCLPAHEIDAALVDMERRATTMAQSDLCRYVRFT